MSLEAAGGSPLSHIVQHPLVQREGPLGTITLLSDQIVMLVIAGLLLCWLVPRALRRGREKDQIERLAPRGLGNFIELVCVYFRDEVAATHLGEHTDRFIKYIWSVFFFILTINLLGLLPLGTLTPPLLGVHIGGTATGNIFVTGTLAVLTGILMVFNGLRFGGKAYLAHFMPGPLYLAPIMLPVEILGLGAKVFALAVRLFANMLAGHVLLAVLLAMILQAGTALGTGGGLAVAVPIVAGSVALNFLEIFVAFLQAFIFTYLTTLFIGMSVNVHHDDHQEAAAH